MRALLLALAKSIYYLCCWPLYQLLNIIINLARQKHKFALEGTYTCSGSNVIDCDVNFHWVQWKADMFTSYVKKCLTRNPSGNWIILIFSGQKPCIRII